MLVNSRQTLRQVALLLPNICWCSPSCENYIPTLWPLWSFPGVSQGLATYELERQTIYSCYTCPEDTIGELRQGNSKTSTHLGSTNGQTYSIHRRGEILLGRQCEGALSVVEDVHSLIRPWFCSLGEISSFVVLQSSHSFVHHPPWWHLGRVQGRIPFWEPHNFHSLLPTGMSFPSQDLLSQLILPLVSNFLKNFGRFLNYLLPISSKY